MSPKDDVLSGNYPQIVILSIGTKMDDFLRTCRRLDLKAQDRERIFWEIFRLIDTPDDNKTERLLREEINFNLMQNQSYLEDDEKERMLKQAVVDVGMAVHEELKMAGMYEYAIRVADGFPYIFSHFLGKDLVLARLPY